MTLVIKIVNFVTVKCQWGMLLERIIRCEKKKQLSFNFVLKSEVKIKYRKIVKWLFIACI